MTITVRAKTKDDITREKVIAYRSCHSFNEAQKWYNDSNKWLEHCYDVGFTSNAVDRLYELHSRMTMVLTKILREYLDQEGVEC